MTEAILKLLGASLLCMGLMALVDGPMREVLRLGCGALITLVTAQTLLQLLPGEAPQLWDRAELEQVILHAQEQAAENQRTIISEALSGYIAQQGAAAGGVCTGQVVYTVDQNGICTVKEARIRWESGSREAMAVLRRALSHDFGLPESRIIIQEVGT